MENNKEGKEARTPAEITAGIKGGSTRKEESGKEALTAEEFYHQQFPNVKNSNNHEFNTYHMIEFAHKFALLKVAEKDKEIERLNLFINDTLLERIRILEKQVSEVAESRKANGDLKEIRRQVSIAAKDYYTRECTNPAYGNEMITFCQKDFIAGANWALGEIVPPEKEIEPTMRTFEGHIKMLAIEFEEAGKEYEANVNDPVVNAKGANSDYFKGKSDAYKYAKGKLNAALKWYGKATLAN